MDIYMLFNLPLLFLSYLFSKVYIAKDAPRIVLNKLEKVNYKVICVTGVGQTCIWTLHNTDD